MSVIGTGTGTAAAVAQTALQAQQVARRRDKDRTSAASDARRLRDILEAHLLAVEEGDESGSPAQLHIDGEMPDHQALPVDQQRKPHEYTNETPVEAIEPGPAGEGPLYRHLDIQA